MRDLGVSSEQVDSAISGEDFEQAAHHIHRYNFFKIFRFDFL